MQPQEELAALFSRNLTFQSAPNPVPTPQVYQTTKPEEAITYSITQHYHHSAHIAAPKQSRPASTSATDSLTTEIILARHGVDVTTLFPSQIELFKTADASQQMRLVELWRISPPNYGGHALANDLGTWPATSFQQEESMAQIRYERQMAEERAARSHMVESSDDMMSDGEQSNAPITPIQGGDSRWGGSHVMSEPYMESGYEAMAQREYELSSQPSKDIYSHFGMGIGGSSYNKATDPVYASSSGGWGTRTAQEQQAAMENAYGSYAQGQQYNAGVCVSGHHGQDEEML